MLPGLFRGFESAQDVLRVVRHCICDNTGGGGD